MNVHKNARLTPHSRAELVRRVLVERQPPMSVATDMGVSTHTVRKWVGRYQAEGETGLLDRSSRPHRLRCPTPAPVVEQIETLRRRRLPGKQIATIVGISTATVSRVLQRLGISVARVMTDNDGCYKSRAFRAACKNLDLKHIRTRPYTPKTNGKAERFIQTSLREWAYARAYPTSDDRAAELPRWLHNYNWHRPHGGINYQTPISRLGLDKNNLLRLHI